jgi:hypothetical protein
MTGKLMMDLSRLAGYNPAMLKHATTALQALPEGTNTRVRIFPNMETIC